MTTLLDTLKKNLGSVGTATEPATDETGTVAKLLSARKGIVGGQPTTPRGFSIAEAAAKGQTQQQLSQLGEQAKLQETAIEQASKAQATEQQQQEQRLAGQVEENRVRNRIQTESVLQDLEQNRAKLNETQRQAGMEKAASLLRFQNSDYINNLQMEAAKSRLDDANSFALALAKDVFNNNQELLKSELGRSAIRDQNDRDFDKKIAQMGINEAIRVARSEAANAETQAGVGTAVELGKIGVSTYGKAKEGAFSQDYQTYADQQREAGKYPVSYTTWQNQQGASAAKGNLPTARTGIMA